MAARDADLARLRGEAAAASVKLAERERLLAQVALMDSVARQQGELLSTQAAEAAALVLASAALETKLASASERVEELTLHTQGGSRMVVLGAQPCLVTRSLRKLTGSAPLDRRGASWSSLGSDWGIYCGGEERSSNSNGQQSADAVSEAPPLGEAYALNLSTHAWVKVPGGKQAARTRHSLATLQCSPAAMLVLGGRGGAQRMLMADAALMVAPSEEEGGAAPRWAAASLALEASAGACAREQAGACASAQRAFMLGGRDAAGGAPASDVVCLDATLPHSLAGLPHPAAAVAQHHSGLRPRTSAACAADADGRRVWLFGGRALAPDGAGGALLHDLLTYDADTGAWTGREAAPGDAPCAREGAAAAVAGEFLLLAGGFSAAGGPLTDLWALHTEAMAWTCLQPSEQAPPPALTAQQSGGAYASFQGTTLRVLRPGRDGRLSALETLHVVLPSAVQDAVDEAQGAAAAAADGAIVTASTLRLWPTQRDSASLELAWRPPARNADRITGYTLLMTPAGGTTSAAVYRGKEEKAVVVGLRTACAYIFSLRAAYDDGMHTWSDTLSVSTLRSQEPRRAQEPEALPALRPRAVKATEQLCTEEVHGVAPPEASPHELFALAEEEEEL